MHGTYDMCSTITSKVQCPVVTYDRYHRCGDVGGRMGMREKPVHSLMQRGDHETQLKKHLGVVCVRYDLGLDEAGYGTSLQRLVLGRVDRQRRQRQARIQVREAFGVEFVDHVVHRMCQAGASSRGHNEGKVHFLRAGSAVNRGIVDQPRMVGLPDVFLPGAAGRRVAGGGRTGQHGACCGSGLVVGNRPVILGPQPWDTIAGQCGSRNVLRSDTVTCRVPISLFPVVIPVPQAIVEG